MNDVSTDVIVVGGPRRLGGGILPVVALPLSERHPDELVALVEDRPDAQVVLVVHHPFDDDAASGDDAREVEDAWVEFTGELVDVAEQLGGDRCIVVRWEDLGAGRTADLESFLQGEVPIATGSRAPVGADRGPEGYRPSRAARALAVELGYQLGVRGPAGSDDAPAEPRGPVGRIARVAGAGDRAPASSAQQRLLFMESLEPGLAVHHLRSVRRITGRLDIAALERSLSLVVERHEALRTDYELVDGHWFQVVAPPTAVPLPLDDLREVPADRRDEVLAEALAAEVSRPFDLADGLKIRGRLLRTADEEHVFVVTLHHIASDGSSIVKLTTDVSTHYASEAFGASPELPSLPVRYIDYTLWQRAYADSEEFATQLSYWRDDLAGSLAPLDLPTDRPRPPLFDHRSRSVPVEIGSDLTARWRAAARKSGVTPFMLLLASYAATLARWTAGEEVVVGIANANRRAETEHLVGLFASTLPIRLPVDADAPFSTLVGDVKRKMLGALGNQDVPFDEIVRAVNPVRDRSRSPIFQTLFVLNNMRPSDAAAPGGISVEDMSVDGGAIELDLSVTLEEGPGGLVGHVDFATALFDEATIERFVDHWLRLLARAVEDPETALGALDLLSDEERELVEHRFASPVPRPAGVDGVTRLDELVGLRVLAAPGAPAFEHAGATMTYGEWDRRANQLARQLRASGVEPGARVGIAVDRSLAMVTAVLAVLKCGAAYVPLDPDLPPDRLVHMITDAGVRIAVTSSGSLDGVLDRPELSGAVTTVDVVRDAATIDGRDDRPVGVDTSGEPGGGAAWVIYTSGSTGLPKGVEVEHASALNFVLAMVERPGLTADDVLLAIPNLSFDPSVLDLFVPAVVGARVVIASQADKMDAGRLAGLIESSGATVMQATPTTWSMLLRGGWNGSRRLRALCGGEAMSTELATRLRDLCGTVWNVYGPTETTVWATAHEVVDTSLRSVDVPVGTPVANYVCRIVDARGQAVPIGVPGEILVGGAGVARGYLNRPELTAERFVPDPFDPEHRMYRTGDLGRWLPSGDIAFIGRRDFQIKLHGHRIELGEIEAALHDVDGVADAVVVPWGAGEAMRLVAYVIPTPGAPVPGTTNLRAGLLKRIPSQWMPSSFVPLDAFPLTPSGKIDRRALPEPTTRVGSPDDDRPRDGLETQLVGWFAEVLDKDTVGIHDDFFELGGYSLLATQLFAAIEAGTGRRIPVSTLFEAPTVATLADVVRNGESNSARTSVVAIQPAGTELPFFYVAPYMIGVVELARLGTELGSDQPLYGIQPQGLDGQSPVHATIEDMAAHYIAEMKTIQPVGPYRIGGHCAGSWVAFEMARQLEEAGEELDHVVLVDQGPPGVEHDVPAPWRYIAMRIGFYRRDRRLLHAIRWQLKIWTKRRVLRRVAPRTVRYEEAVREVHRQAYAAYEGGHVDKELVLVRSDESLLLEDKEWHLEWRAMTSGGIRVAHTRGTHANLLKAGYVDDFAKRLRWAFHDDDATYPED